MRDDQTPTTTQRRCWACDSLKLEPYTGHPDFTGWQRCQDCGTLLSAACIEAVEAAERKTAVARRETAVARRDLDRLNRLIGYAEDHAEAVIDELQARIKALEAQVAGLPVPIRPRRGGGHERWR